MCWASQKTGAYLGQIPDSDNQCLFRAVPVYLVCEKETYVMFSDSDLPNPYEIAIAGMSNLFCLKYLLSFDTLTLSVS